MGQKFCLARSQTYLVPGENPLDATTRTYAAIETACLDLIGRSVGKPACDLIGGRVRDKVPFSAYAFFKHQGGGGAGTDARADEYGEVMTPAALAREVKQMTKNYGFGSVKLKGGVLVNTPLASNVAVTSFADIPGSLQLDATQIILCDHHYWGGMRQVQNLAALCRVFNLGLSMHSNSHLGVSLMAMAHVNRVGTDAVQSSSFSLRFQLAAKSAAAKAEL